MDWQPFINIGAGSALACFGWFLRTMYDAVSCLKRSVHEIEMNVASNYVKKDEMREIMEKIDKRFDKMEELIAKIFDKLDTKMDKP